jgi:hypothetical protein
MKKTKTTSSTPAVSRWTEINHELKQLDRKLDQESRTRFNNLLEELMCADMALKPYKDAMKKASENKSAAKLKDE